MDNNQNETHRFGKEYKSIQGSGRIKVANDLLNNCVNARRQGQDSNTALIPQQGQRLSQPTKEQRNLEYEGRRQEVGERSYAHVR